MKRAVLILLSSIVVLFFIWGVDRAIGAGCTPAALGGTGTCTVPSSGQIPIGNGSGSYTPATLTPGANIVITNASGSVTIGVTGTATGTVYLLQAGHGISLSPASITSSGTIAVNTSTVIADVVASGQFLPSSTTYVASVNGQSGAVAIGIPATTTVNGTQATVFNLIGDGTTVTSTVNGATTTFSVVTSGNWQGTWQGVNSSTFYKASNPSGYISGNQTILLTGAITGSGTTTIATTYSTSTLYSLFSGSGPVTFNASTGAIGWTNSLNYITGVTVNGQSGTSFSIIVGPGLSSSVSGATTTLSLNLGAGCTGGNFVQTISATGTITCAIPSGSFTTTTINHTASLAFVLQGDGSTITSTTSGATTTYSVIPGVYLTPASGTAMFYPLSGNPSGFTTTTQQQVLNALSAAGCLTYSTSTGVFTATCLSTSTAATTYYPLTNPSGYVTSSVVSGFVNGTGTANDIPIFTATGTIGNSPLSYNGSGNVTSSASMAFLNSNSPIMYNASNHYFNFYYNSNNGIYLQGDLLGSTYAFFTASGWVFNTNVAVDNSTAFPPTNYGFAVGQGKASVFSGEVDIGTSATSSVKEGDMLHVVGNADVTGALAVGTTNTTTAQAEVSSTIETALDVHSGTATTTVIEGATSSPTCVKTYGGGTALYTTYLSSGQVLTSTNSCQ